MKRPSRIFSHRLFYIAIALLLQIITLAVVILRFSEHFVYFYAVMEVLGAVTVLYISTTDIYPSYKVTWVVSILLLPIFGTVFYLLFGRRKSTKSYTRRMKNINNKMMNILTNTPNIMDNFEKQDISAANLSRYIQNYAYAPPGLNSPTQFLESGEKFFESLVAELKKAENYIFMEYFIIEPGLMWNTILEILEEKAAEGVDVRVIYDDVGCLFTLPSNYDSLLREKGIKCHPFNKFYPVLSLHYNNRDHRKITVIDGKVAFNGGANLADEYINAVEKHGHWKDSAVMLEGPAVANLATMFLTMWEGCTNEQLDYSSYLPSQNEYSKQDFSGGVVQPFTDSPLDNEHVSELVYLYHINRANHYIYITTPYLVIGNEILGALTAAAKSGIDVRIITPHVPDKWYVHEVSRAHYETLTKNNVKIYEYSPGFIHSKTIVSDDITAVVGTINLDYRSMYLHFECGTWLYNCPTVAEIKNDFLKTLELCEEVTYEDCKKVPYLRRLVRSALNLFSPLM